MLTTRSFTKNNDQVPKDPSTRTLRSELCARRKMSSGGYGGGYDGYDAKQGQSGGQGYSSYQSTNQGIKPNDVLFGRITKINEKEVDTKESLSKNLDTTSTAVIKEVSHRVVNG